ncbi:MAG TPA: 4'-phosphopantetheinyl transferase superfamily protein [Pseudobacteroides sp.]|uniref:4'-phosphopantetheinyl transferase family protein n=1 Tax=Pseudobacteroides sp. TaxID=1968840 RepID=UPI002F935ECE
MSEVFALKIDSGTNVGNYDRLMSCVSSEKQARIKKYRMQEDALRALFGDLMVRYVICTRLNLTNEELFFKLNDYGKPYLLGNTDFNFNISHSGEWVVCIADSSPAGIDVEGIRSMDMKIAERFFSKDELIDINSKQPCDRVDYFFQLWTLKESYIKACGKGLSIPLDSFSIRMAANNIYVEDSNGSSKWFFKQYDIGEGYKMAACSMHNKFPDNVERIGVLELSGFFDV